MKWSADVHTGFDFHIEDIEADSLEEAKSIAYDLAKTTMDIHDPRVRPFTISVTVVYKKDENSDESKR